MRRNSQTMPLKQLSRLLIDKRNNAGIQHSKAVLALQAPGIWCEELFCTPSKWHGDKLFIAIGWAQTLTRLCSSNKFLSTGTRNERRLLLHNVFCFVNYLSSPSCKRQGMRNWMWHKVPPGNLLRITDTIVRLRQWFSGNNPIFCALNNENEQLAYPGLFIARAICFERLTKCHHQRITKFFRFLFGNTAPWYFLQTPLASQRLFPAAGCCRKAEQILFIFSRRIFLLSAESIPSHNTWAKWLICGIYTTPFAFQTLKPVVHFRLSFE